MGSVVKTPKVQVWGMWVEFLVGELRSHKPCNEAKKKIKEKTLAHTVQQIGPCMTLRTLKWGKKTII